MRMICARQYLISASENIRLSAPAGGTSSSNGRGVLDRIGAPDKVPFASVGAPLAGTAGAARWRSVLGVDLDCACASVNTLADIAIASSVGQSIAVRLDARPTSAGRLRAPPVRRATSRAS